ncbi:MAG: transposase [Calditrichaeota bacterium]|nr:transposase [Calditrichota bacterium]
MQLSDLSVRSVDQHLPHANSVFDRFHVKKHFDRF